MKKYLNAIKRIKDIQNAGGKIYIRGAGGEGKQLFNEFMDLGINITAFIDINYETLKTVCNVPVLPPEYVFQNSVDIFFVIVAVKNTDAYKKIAQEMQRNGLVLGRDFADFGINPDLRMNPFTLVKPSPSRLELQKKCFDARVSEMQQLAGNFSFVSSERNTGLIGNLDLVLTTYCNLECSFCSHCIPQCKKPAHYDIKQCVSDLDKLLSVSIVACVALMGGEPFMHPHFLEFLKRYHKMSNLKNIGFTRIVTNGTIVPRDDILEEFAKIKNAYVYISNYGESSRKINQLVEKCKQYGILYYIAPGDIPWVDLGDFDYDRYYTEEELRHLYLVCDSSICTQLIDGHLYSCGRTPILNEDRLIPYREKDFCDIRNISVETLKKTLNNYLYNTPYLNGCRYCDGQHVYSKQVERGF